MAAFLDTAYRHLGLIYAFLSVLFFILMDLFAQYLLVVDDIDVVSLIFLRMIFSLIVSYSYLYYTKYEHLPFGPKQHRPLLVLRSCTHHFALSGFFYAARHITLSDIMTIMQARPLLLGFFLAILLDEPMNAVQKIAGGVSVFGEILIAKPTMLFSPPPSSEIIKSGPSSITHSSTSDHFTALAVGFGVLFFVVFEHIIIRGFRGEVEPFNMLAMTSLATVIFAPLTLWFTGAPLVLPSSLTAWSLLLLVQVFGVISQILVAKALILETANVVALVSQLQVVPAAVCEYLVFGSHFDALSAVGAMITTVAGLWAIIRGGPEKEDKSSLPTTREDEHAMAEMPLLSSDEAEHSAKDHVSG